jgi:two-component system, LytTR family, response regulator
MMLRTIAVDDEPLALALLEDNIRQIPYLQLIAACSNALEANEFMRKETVDLIFLDIQMPGLTGFQFISSLTVKPMIIMITAYEKYALEGFNVDVVDYLVKPVSLERFFKACNKASELHALRTQSPPGNNVEESDHIFVNAEYSLIKVLFNDIIMIEGLRDYIKIHLLNDKSLMIRMSMKSIEEKLPAKKFLRVHKSYIVSLARITSIRKNAIFLGKTEVVVSDMYKEALMAAIGNA